MYINKHVVNTIKLMWLRVEEDIAAYIMPQKCWHIYYSKISNVVGTNIYGPKRTTTKKRAIKNVNSPSSLLAVSFQKGGGGRRLLMRLNLFSSVKSDTIVLYKIVSRGDQF